MIVKVISGVNEYDDWRNVLEIEVNGEPAVSFYDGEPEDANLMRDFADCYSIPDLMEQAYNAGKSGETFEIVNVESDNRSLFEKLVPEDLEIDDDEV